MRLLRGLPGAVLWILAAVLGLVGALPRVTVILLPLGISLVSLPAVCSTAVPCS